MCRMRQKLRFFFISLFLFPFLRYSSFCIFNHPMIYQIYDITMSVSTWDTLHFSIYLVNRNSLSHQICPINKQTKKFSGIFRTIWRNRAKFQVLFNLATCTNYSITTYVKIPVLHFFWKGEWETFQNEKS